MTSIFWAGAWTALLAGMLFRSRRLTWTIGAAWFGGAVLALSSYLYIAFRASHPGASSVWPVLEPGWRGWLAHITARSYQQNLGRWMPDADERALLQGAVYPLLWPGLALLAWLGARAGTLRDRVVWWGLLAPALAHLAFVYRYGVNDPQAYFVPPLAMALLSTVPPAAWLARALPRARMIPAAAALAALALLAALAIPGVRSAREDQVAMEQVDARLLQLFRSVPFERGILLWPSGNYHRLKFYQAFLHEKPGLDIHATASLCNDLPRTQFRRKYGFDPMAEARPESLSAPVRADFIVGTQASALETALFARVHRTIVDSASVPVALFNPPDGVRVFHGPRASGVR